MTMSTEDPRTKTQRFCSYRVILLLFQLSLLLLLPLGLHVHRLGDEITQDAHRLGIGDEWMLNTLKNKRDKEKERESDRGMKQLAQMTND